MSAVRQEKKTAPTASAPPVVSPTRPATPPPSPARAGAASLPTPPFPTIRPDGLGLAPWALPPLPPPHPGPSGSSETPPKKRGKGPASPASRRRWSADRAAAARPPSPPPSPFRPPWDVELEALDRTLRCRLGLPEGHPIAAPDPEGERATERLEDAAAATFAEEWTPVVVLVESFAVGDNRDLDADPDPDSPPPPFPAEGDPSSEEEVEVASAASALHWVSPPGPLRIEPWRPAPEDGQ